jgi:hypothetical protein
MILRHEKIGPLNPSRTHSNVFHAGQWIFPAVACLLFLLNRAPFLGQWDSFDYVKQVVNHQFSDLAIGRPVFIAYNIGWWESMRWLLHLAPLQAETVMMYGIMIAGGLGVVLFMRFSYLLLSPQVSRMAVLALVVSPMYVIYSASIMTEVPMLVAALCAAVVLWDDRSDAQIYRNLAGGLAFGAAVGIREQALTLGAAYLWLLWVRRSGWRSRIQSLIIFSISSLAIILLPVGILYLKDPAAFARRLQDWFLSIPTERVHFPMNVEASFIFTLAICPGAWLGVLYAGVYQGWKNLRHFRRRSTECAASSGSLSGEVASRGGGIPCLGWAVFCGLILPIAALWRDADVQIHPRYCLIALPASLIFCAAMFHRWLPSRRAAVAWAVLQVGVFGMAQIVIHPFRDLYDQKKEYALMVRTMVPGAALLIPGGYSPIIDYYRGLGDRPDWKVLWSGWRWNAKDAEKQITEAWRQREPVFLCEGPRAWAYFEDEWFDLFFFLRGHQREVIAPGLTRVYPEQDDRGKSQSLLPQPFAWQSEPQP